MRISDWSSDVCSSDLGIAESHAAFTLQPIKRCFVRDIVAIVMGYGECYLFTGIITAGKGALAVFNSESDVAAHELDAAIAHQRAGKQARFSQYLKAVADARSDEHTSELQSLMRNSYAV